MQKVVLKHTRFQSGQALVLVLLSLSVVLTVVLFLLSRSISDISTSTEQSDSVRAFSAAEAGVERALITGSSENNVTVGGATYSVDVGLSTGGTSFNYPVALMSGEAMTFWFVAHNASGAITCSTDYPCFTGNTLNLCWGNNNTPAASATTPAIEVSVYYETTPGNLSTIRIARATFDPYNYSSIRMPVNAFSKPDNISSSCLINGVHYAFQKSITFSDLGIPAGSYNTQGGLVFAKIRMIYNNVGHSIGISSSSTFPSQGINIVSTGSYGTSDNQSNRRVSVFQGWPDYPFSGLAIFIPSGVTK